MRPNKQNQPATISDWVEALERQRAILIVEDARSLTPYSALYATSDAAVKTSIKLRELLRARCNS